MNDFVNKMLSDIDNISKRNEHKYLKATQFLNKKLIGKYNGSTATIKGFSPNSYHKFEILWDGYESNICLDLKIFDIFTDKKGYITFENFFLNKQIMLPHANSLWGKIIDYDKDDLFHPFVVKLDQMPEWKAEENNYKNQDTVKLSEYEIFKSFEL